MLNRDMDFARLSVHMHQVKEKKKKIAEAREKDRRAKRARTADQNHSQQRVAIGVVDGRRRRIGVTLSPQLVL